MSTTPGTKNKKLTAKQSKVDEVQDLCAQVEQMAFLEAEQRQEVIAMLRDNPSGTYIDMISALVAKDRQMFEDIMGDVTEEEAQQWLLEMMEDSAKEQRVQRSQKEQRVHKEEQKTLEQLEQYFQ